MVSVDYTSGWTSSDKPCELYPFLWQCSYSTICSVDWRPHIHFFSKSVFSRMFFLDISAYPHTGALWLKQSSTIPKITIYCWYKPKMSWFMTCFYPQWKRPHGNLGMPHLNWLRTDVGLDQLASFILTLDGNRQTLARNYHDSNINVSYC